MEVFERSPNDPARRTINPFLKIALELGPLVVFFLGNAYGDRLATVFPPLAELGGRLFVGTALFIVATVIALALSLILLRRLPIMPFVSGVIVLIFGVLTIYYQNEEFIKLKPTIIYTMFGATLLVGLCFGLSLLGYVFEDAFRLDDTGWRKLTLRWGIFFLAMAILNEVIWRSFSTDTWVASKLFVFLPLPILFTLTQLPLIQKHSLPEAEQS